MAKKKVAPKKVVKKAKLKTGPAKKASSKPPGKKIEAKAFKKEAKLAKKAKPAVAKASPVKAEAPKKKASAKAQEKDLVTKSLKSLIATSKKESKAENQEPDLVGDPGDFGDEAADFAEDLSALDETEVAGTVDDDEAALPIEEVAKPKKPAREKSASERRVRKERDLLAGIDRNGDLSQVWQKFFDGQKGAKPRSYSMRDTFEARSGIQHPKLGWGFILSNINDRLEVLFKDGIKILISNYKNT